MNKTSPNVTSKIQGPLLVALGAVLWATDSLFRSQVIGHYSPLFIVFFNHLLCLTLALPMLIKRRHWLFGLSLREWLALIFLATFGSALAMIAFTKAFALTSNYTSPILMQKLQPLFAMGLARWILKERTSPRYPLWAALALGGAYLVSFGAVGPGKLLGGQGETEVFAYAALAAVIWGATTVAGRLLLSRLDYVFVTAARFVGATIFIWILLLVSDGLNSNMFMTSWEWTRTALLQDFWPFFLMAFVSGILPLMLYYFGLKTTPATTATLCELAFPLAAIAFNWWFLKTPLSGSQLLGAGLLLFAITALTRENAKGLTLKGALP